MYFYITLCHALSLSVTSSDRSMHGIALQLKLDEHWPKKEKRGKYVLYVIMVTDASCLSESSFNNGKEYIFPRDADAFVEIRAT